MITSNSLCGCRKGTLLFEERKQVGEQECASLFIVGVLFEIEHLEVFSKAISVKILVRVIKQDGFAIIPGHLVIASGGHRLAERSAVLKGETGSSKFRP